jgi:hypothetical protein
LLHHSFNAHILVGNDRTHGVKGSQEYETKRRRLLLIGLSSQCWYRTQQQVRAGLGKVTVPISLQLTGRLLEQPLQTPDTTANNTNTNLCQSFCIRRARTRSRKSGIYKTEFKTDPFLIFVAATVFNPTSWPRLKRSSFVNGLRLQKR